MDFFPNDSSVNHTGTGVTCVALSLEGVISEFSACDIIREVLG